MITRVLLDPNPAGGGGAATQNGDSHPAKVTTDHLEAALAKLSQPEPVKQDDATDAGDKPVPSALEAVAGAQAENDSTETKPDGDEATVETDLSQSQEGEQETTATLPPELAGLPEDIRTQLLELAKEVADGKTSFGQLKRGHKLQDEIQELQKQLEDARKTPVANVAEGKLHPEVAKLNSESEIANKRAELKQLVKECRLHANGYTTEDGNEIPPERVRMIQADAENKLDDLQDRSLQLQQTNWVKGEQAKVEQQVRQHGPEFFDEKTPLGLRFKSLVNDPLLAQLPNRHFAAACYAMGEQVLLARVQKPAAAAAKPVAKPGAVQKAKPAMSGGGGAPAKQDANRQRFESAMPKPGSKVKPEDLERVLAAMPS